MLKTFLNKNSNTLISQRFIFKVEFGGENFQKLTEAATNAPAALEKNKDKKEKTLSGEDNKAKEITDISTYCDTLATNAATESDTQYNAEKKKLGAVPPSPPALNEDGSNKEEVEKATKLKADYDAKMHELTVRHEAFKASLEPLKKAAIAALKEVEAAQKKEMEQFKADVEKAVIAQVDSVALRDAEIKADFADDLADTGGYKEFVHDYLDTTMKTPDGRVIELNDTSLARITMGIVAVLHDPKQNADRDDENGNDPAVRFMQKVKAASDKMDDVRYDNGTNVDDVRLALLQQVGYKTDERKEEKTALRSQVAKLFDAIITDESLRPPLRGMLLGELAKAQKGEKGFNEICAKVARMHKLLKDTGNAKLAEEEGVGDESGVEKAYHIFTTLEDLEADQQISALDLRYNTFLKISGQKEDPELKKNFQELNDGELDPEEYLSKVEAKVNQAIKEYKESKIAERLDSKIEEVKKLYKRINGNLEFSFPDEEKVKLMASGISTFNADLEALVKKVDMAKVDPKVVEAAKVGAFNMNKYFTEVREYQENVNKYSSHPEISGLPAITNDYSQLQIDAGKTPEEILKQIDGYTFLGSDQKIFRANKSKLDDFINNLSLKSKSSPSLNLKPTLQERATKPEGFSDKPITKLPPEITNKVIKNIQKSKKAWVEVKIGETVYLAEKVENKISWYEKAKK